MLTFKSCVTKNKVPVSFIMYKNMGMCDELTKQMHTPIFSFLADSN